MGENELYHYGVLGMKWGVRRTPEQLGHKTDKPKKTRIVNGEESKKVETKQLVAAQNISKDLAKVVNALKQYESESASKRKSKLREGQRKKASEMSNRELQELIQRMSLEDQYANLSSNRMSVGKTYTDEILSGVGEGLAIVGSIFSILISAKILTGK